MEQEPLWPHTTNPLSQTIQNLEKKILANNTTMWDELYVHCIFVVKQTYQYSHEFLFLHSSSRRDRPGYSNYFPHHFVSDPY
jgi:hypothetical protein